MLRLIACVLSGQHDYRMGREPGAVFLRCTKCGHRSPGWTVDPEVATRSRRAGRAVSAKATDARPVLTLASERGGARVLPFVRTAAH